VGDEEVDCRRPRRAEGNPGMVSLNHERSITALTNDRMLAPQCKRIATASLKSRGIL